MPDIGFAATSHLSKRRMNAALAEIADHGLADLMREDAAARVLVLARRLALGGYTAGAETPAEALVNGVAEGWDPVAMTAGEYADSLGVVALEAFLLASRAWAAAHGLARVMQAKAA